MAEHRYLEKKRIPGSKHQMAKKKIPTNGKKTINVSKNRQIAMRPKPAPFPVQPNEDLSKDFLYKTERR